MPALESYDQPAERIEAIDAIWRAVQDLNPDLKMALLLRDVVGLPYNEIADSLEITLATVKWRIFKAREEVQLTLARDGITFADPPRRRRCPARSSPERRSLSRVPGGRRAPRAGRPRGSRPASARSGTRCAGTARPAARSSISQAARGSPPRG